MYRSEVRGQAGRTVLMYAAECGLDDVAWSPASAQREIFDASRQLETHEVVAEMPRISDVGGCASCFCAQPRPS